MSTLSITAMNRKVVCGHHMRVCAWIGSGWFLLSLAGMVALATTTGVVTGAPAGYWSGQIVLGLCVYLALFLLANRPLFNPIQAVVALFYWWLGVGPAVIATWNVLMGLPEEALQAEVSGMEALWIVAPGLLVYAVAARLTLQWFAKTGVCARFLLPKGDNYRPRVLIIYFSLPLLSTLALQVLAQLGIRGQEEMNFLGGTKTTIWWVGVIAGVSALAPFATSALMTYVTTPWKTIPTSARVLIGLTVVQTVVFALFGGWKGPLAALGASYAIAYLCRQQRPPWLVLAVGVLVLLVFIAPFVSYARHAALMATAGDSGEREEVFSEVLKEPESFLPNTMEAIDPAVFFRGISPLAGELTRRNDFFHGEWHGDTIVWGLEILVPRVLMPDKRDTAIGNFFSQTVGVDIGVSNSEDTLTNIAVAIPFEFVGNYGWCAGILSFGLIGVFWALLCGWLLSPARLSSHPLTPFLVLSALGMEAPLGHFLVQLRGLCIPLLVCLFVYGLLRKKL